MGWVPAHHHTSISSNFFYSLYSLFTSLFTLSSSILYSHYFFIYHYHYFLLFLYLYYLFSPYLSLLLFIYRHYPYLISYPHTSFSYTPYFLLLLIATKVHPSSDILHPFLSHIPNNSQSENFHPPNKLNKKLPFFCKAPFYIK